MFNFNYLSNPLETFKSFVYDFNFTQISNQTSQILITNPEENLSFVSYNWSNFPFFFSFENLLNNNEPFFTHISFLLTIILLVIYFEFIKNKNSFFLTILTVLISQIVFYIFSIQSFYYTNIVFDNQDLNIFLENANFAVVSVLCIKESLSFISLFLMWWFFSNYSLSDTLLMPKTLIETLDEVMYRQNLDLFASTLDLKHNHDVKHFQEFFIKGHGLLLFILIANVQGMVPFSSTITSSLMNTFYISLAVFINIIITIVKEKGFSYLFGLFLPSGCPFPLIPLLNPIEFISYTFRLVSLSVRLFANMMAGHTLMKVIAGFSWSLILLGDVYILVHYVPFFVLFILTFLEIAVGFIQTYIFIILVYIYLSDIFVGH